MKQTKLPQTFYAATVPRARLLARYLVYSCLYYKFDRSFISDFEYDTLAATLATYMGDRQVIEHPHYFLVDIEFIHASSSGYYIDFPAMVYGCCQHLIRTQTKGVL